MKDHQLIRVLQGFDQAMCRRFAAFLQSPYHNTVSKLNELGDFFISHYPHFDSSKLTEEGAYAVIYPSKAFNKHELTRYMSKLFVLVEEFITIESLKKEQYLKGTLKGGYYYTSQNTVRFRKAHQATQKLINKEVAKTSASYFYTYLNQKKAHDFLIQHREKEKAKTILLAATDALNYYFKIETLQAASTIVYQFESRNLDAHVPLLASTIEHIEINIDSQPPLILCWYYAYKLLVSPGNSETYQKLKMQMEAKSPFLPDIDARNFMFILTKSLKQQTQGDRARYLEERFSINQIEVNQGWIIADGIVDYRVLNNIITTSLLNNQIAFAESFLLEYQQYLIPEVKEHIVLYNQARIAFAKEDYGTCLTLIQQTAYLDTLITLGVKRLQLMVYFEQENIEALLSGLNAFAVYLHRMGVEKKGDKNRNQIFLKMIKILDKMNQEGIEDKLAEQFDAMIASHPFMVEQEWLEQKRAQLF
ncbi:MAG: hypothetical protein AB8F95_22045 [Bacteroidia bacterium]